MFGRKNETIHRLEAEVEDLMGQLRVSQHESNTYRERSLKRNGRIVELEETLRNVQATLAAERNVRNDINPYGRRLYGHLKGTEICHLEEGHKATIRSLKAMACRQFVDEEIGR